MGWIITREDGQTIVEFCIFLVIVFLLLLVGTLYFAEVGIWHQAATVDRRHQSWRALRVAPTPPPLPAASRMRIGDAGLSLPSSSYDDWELSTAPGAGGPLPPSDLSAEDLAGHVLSPPSTRRIVYSSRVDSRVEAADWTSHVYDNEWTLDETSVESLHLWGSEANHAVVGEYEIALIDNAWTHLLGAH